jgi:hypothetical protein
MSLPEETLNSVRSASDHDLEQIPIDFTHTLRA